MLTSTRCISVFPLTFPQNMNANFVFKVVATNRAQKWEDSVYRHGETKGYIRANYKGGRPDEADWGLVYNAYPMITLGASKLFSEDVWKRQSKFYENKIKTSGQSNIYFSGSQSLIGTSYITATNIGLPYDASSNPGVIKSRE